MTAPKRRSRRLTIACLNLTTHPRHERHQARRLIRLLSQCHPDVALLQECPPEWVPELEVESGLTAVHSCGGEPNLDSDGLNVDGCVIALRGTRGEVETAWRINPEDFTTRAVRAALGAFRARGIETDFAQLRLRHSANTLIARALIDGRRVTLGSFHAPSADPGAGEGLIDAERRAHFHGGVAVALSRLRAPYLFGIDSVRPTSESAPRSGGASAGVGPAAAAHAALLGRAPLHKARDLGRARVGGADGGPDDESRAAPGDETQLGPDEPGSNPSIWATRQFVADEIDVVREGVIAAAGTGAMLVARVRAV